MSIVVSLSTVSTTVHFYTVVQDQCTIVALYYCITSLPVYPNTVHGHCTPVVLDTSNSVYCLATLMECTVQCIASPLRIMVNSTNQARCQDIATVNHGQTNPKQALW